MSIDNKYLALHVQDGELAVSRKDTDEQLQLAWPAVAVGLNGSAIHPAKPVGPVTASRRTLSQAFVAGDLRFEVSVTLGADRWFTKRLTVRSDSSSLPTPDYVEVDRQYLPTDGLRRCGYVATSTVTTQQSDEESSGGMPGCGYPLIGRRFFMGLEHPAGFNELTDANGGHEVRMRHYPVWREGLLGTVDGVFGWSDEARSSFTDYLDSIRLPVLKAPLIAFGTFWSDPYLGDREYQVTLAAYEAFFRAFADLGLVPDAFTLDAGWNDRQSVLESKRDVGGDRGLLKLRRLAELLGSSLSLWISHNGPMGIAPEHLKTLGIEVGGGVSSTYCGDGYGVMMDEKLEHLLTARLQALVTQVGACHLKIDWDNECATNPVFATRYPTRNHVRQATLDAFFRIGRALRAANPDVVIRNGWWPSPWWLREANHVWLSDSGDSEFAALPSKTQRDAASTHRDLLYYAILQRDQTPVPLDCFDHHEFPDSLRNPFCEDPASWVNTIWLCFMRGATYLPFTLMPESLENWQVESLRQIMQFCRINAKRIFVQRGRMILGNPGRGEVYGFLQAGPDESWCLIRNPLPVPQQVRFDPAALVTHAVSQTLQFYPHYEAVDLSGGITMPAHEVRIFILTSRTKAWDYSAAHMTEEDESGCLVRFPASQAIRSVQPAIDPIQRLADMKCLWNTRTALPYGVRFQWYLQAPYRMRQLEVQLRIEGRGELPARLKAFSSRYQGASSGYALPITHIRTGSPGHGERMNLDLSCGETPDFYAISVPDGGQFSLTLDIEGVSDTQFILTAWLAGYESPSRSGIHRKRPPRAFAGCLPCQHPLGFGRVLELPVASG